MVRLEEHEQKYRRKDLSKVVSRRELSSVARLLDRRIFGIYYCAIKGKKKGRRNGKIGRMKDCEMQD